jgi:hypothetical protein
MGAREARSASEIIDFEWIGVPGVGEILGAKEVAGWRNECHERSGYPGLCPRCR